MFLVHQIVPARSIAAGGYYFFLDKKVAKNQERGDASTLKPYSRPAPSFRKAFALFFKFLFFSC